MPELNMIEITEVKATKNAAWEASAKLALAGRQKLNLRCSVGMTSGAVMFTLTDEPTPTNIADRSAAYDWLLANEPLLAETVRWAAENIAHD